MAAVHDRPDFDKINRCNVAIQSLRNQLNQSTNIDELTLIASKIIELEQEIINERARGHKKLERKRKTVESKIDKLQRQLLAAQDELDDLDQTIDQRLNGYRKNLISRIEDLNNEFQELSDTISEAGQSNDVSGAATPI